MTYPPPGQPYYPGQPDQNQPQYGGGPSYPQQQQPVYGGESSYQQDSYTTEPPMSGQPYSGQPYSGQPYSGVPYDQGYSAQPGYPQPGSAQGYDQAGYNQGHPQQGGYAPQGTYAPPQHTPSFVAPPAPRGNKGGMIALLVSGAVLLLLVVGIGAVVLLRSGEDEPIVSPGGRSAAASADPSPTDAAEYPARIDLPQIVAGMTKVDNEQLNKTANDTALQIKNATNADSAVAAYYAPSGDMTKAVGLVGATGRITNPEGELDDAFSSELTVTGARDIEPGPLGGYMRCGNTATSGQALSVCGWADGGSLMLGIFINRSLDDSATLFKQIRGEILKRG